MPTKTFDIRKIKLYIDDKEITGLAPDGFGITPQGEQTLIPGLTGEQGANIDPSSAFEATVTLKSTAKESMDFLRELWYKQRAGTKSGVELKAIVEPGAEAIFGFARTGGTYAWIQSSFPFQTNEKESPNIAWTLVGYEYFER